MHSGRLWTYPDEDDELRVMALQRVPRCVRCARLRALALGARPGERGPLPAVPSGCHYQLCAPLVRRYERADARDRRAG